MRRLAFFLLGALALAAAALAQSGSASSAASLSPAGTVILYTTSGASLSTSDGTWTFGAFESVGNPYLTLNGVATSGYGPILALDASGNLWSLGSDDLTWYEWVSEAWGNPSASAPSATAGAAQALLRATGIVLSWTAPAHNVDGSWVYPGEISGYDILYSTDASAFADDSEGTYPITSLVVPASASDTFIAGLIAGTTYYFEIATLAADGTMSAYSNAVSGVAVVAALPAAPGAPTIGGGVPLTLAQR